MMSVGDKKECTVDRIERQFFAIDGVRDCVVRARKDAIGNARLVAYVAASPALSRAAVELALQAEHVDPSAVDLVNLNSLPIDPNGVPDEVALKAIPVIDAAVTTRLHALARESLGDADFEVTRDWSTSAIEPMCRATGLAGSNGTPPTPGNDRSSGTGTASAPDAKPSIATGPPINLNDAPLKSIAYLLLNAAETHSNQLLTCVDLEGEQQLTYMQLRERAERVNAGLQAADIKAGEKVAFLFERNLDFLSAFWGCVFAGVVPAPLSVPPSDDPGSAAATKLFNLVDLLGSRCVLTSSKISTSVRALLTASGRNSVKVVELENLLLSAATDAVARESHPDDLALLLLTSGSTGVPKAVTQTHGALISAAHAIGQRAELTETSVCLNWISLEHVGGIVMCHLAFVALGCRQIQVRTDYLLQSPLRWLELMSRFKATFTWAPNFAFALINERAAEVAAGKWDLKSMRFIVNGGESVVARTARRFLRLLAPHGLAADAMRPAWGMSETSSAALFSNRFRLELTSDEDQLVEVGPPNPGVEVRMVDDQDVIVAEGVEGRLQVRGANVTRGYLNNAAANAESFTADGWFRTGDLAILRDAAVTISGREKGVIIINGVNYYAHELEAAVEDVAGVEPSFTAAFAVRMPRAQTDELAVAYHAADSSDASVRALVRAIRAAVMSRAGIAPRVILPLSKDQIPKTDIGKIQRTQLARRFAGGEFAEILQRVDGLTQTSQSGADLFFRTIWQRRELRLTRPIGPKSVILAYAVQTELAYELQACAVSIGARLITVDAGQIDRLETELQPLGAAARLIVVCPGSGDAEGAPSDQGVGALKSVGAAVALTQVLGRRAHRADVLVFDLETQPMVRASLAGFLRTASVEYPQLRVRHVDIASALPISRALLARRLIAEVSDSSSEPEVSWRADCRFVRRLALDSSISQVSVNERLRSEGFFLVTGGLGGIGLEVCRYLLRTSDSPLLIIGRRSLEDVAAARAFASLGQVGRVRYQSLDLADASASLSGVADAEREFGKPLAAIFHLAGDYEPRMISEETPATLAATFRGKVQGVITARRILEAYPAAALYAFSSVNGAMGGFAAGAYSAANAFLDALADDEALRGRACYSLAWSMWHGVGMSAGFAGKDGASRLGYLPLTVKRGLQSMAMISDAAPGHVLIGLDGKNPLVRRQIAGASTVECFGLRVRGASPLLAGKFAALLDSFGNHVPVQLYDRIDQAAATASHQKSPTTSQAGELASETGRILSEVWAEVLQRDSIDPDEKFFDLGGNSVLLASATHKLSERLKRQISITDLFRFPTLRQLALHYNEQNDESPAALSNSQERGLERRARRQQRRSKG